MLSVLSNFEDSQTAPRAVIVKYLLEHKADINARDDRGGTALLHACAQAASLTVIQLLLDHGADASLADQTGRDAYKYA